MKREIFTQRADLGPVFALSEKFNVKWRGRYTYEGVCTSADKLVEVWSADPIQAWR